MVRKCPTCAAGNRDDASFCSACGTSLIASPSVKPVPSVRVVSPVMPAGAPMRVPPPGMCFYHPNLPAIYVCNRCGRPICRDDSKAYQDLVMCPQCYQSVVPIMGAPAPYMMHAPEMLPTPEPFGYGPPSPYFPGATMVPPARSTWGFVVSLIAGIMIIINAAALLSGTFYTLWASIFPWITYFGPPTPWILLAIGLILGIIVAIGSILMVLGYGTIGAVVVFPAAVISLILGGGFIAGFILGVVGGILGMLGR